MLLRLRQGGEQAVLQLAHRLQVLQQHARFLQGFVGLKQTGGQGQGSGQQHGRVLAGQGQGHGGRLGIELAAVEGAAAHKHGHRVGELSLAAQFLGGAAEVGGDRLA